MSRPVKEWIGRTDSTPAPARVKARIVMAQDGICACGCGVKLGAAGEGIDFDHTQALILGGENRESNLRALRRPCPARRLAGTRRQGIGNYSRVSRARSNRAGGGAGVAGRERASLLDADVRLAARPSTEGAQRWVSQS